MIVHSLDAHRARVVFAQARALLKRSRRLLAEFRAVADRLRQPTT